MQRALFLTLLLSALFCASTWAKYEESFIRPIICDDPEIPGLPGVTARVEPFDDWTIGPGGHVVGTVRLQGENIISSNDEALVMVNPGGELSLVIREGDAIGGGTFQSNWAPVVSVEGNIAFRALLNDGSTYVAMLAGAPGLLKTVITTRETVGSDFDEEAVVTGISDPVMNSGGTFAFTIEVLIGATTHSAIYTSTGDGRSLAVRHGEVYIGLPEKADEQHPTDPTFIGDGLGSNLLIGESGDLVFNASVDDGQLGIGQFRAVWKYSGGAVEELVREGEFAPSLGDVTLNSVGPVSMGGENVILVTGLSGTGVVSGNNTAYWVLSGGNISLLFREGDVAPVPAGVEVGEFRDEMDIGISQQGTVLIRGRLSNNVSGLWVSGGGNGLQPVAAVGGAVDTYPGNSWTQINQVAINPHGLILFQARHQGEQPPGNNLWIYDSGLHEIKANYQLTLPDGSSKSGGARNLPTNNNFISNGQNRPQVFNARGEILFDFAFNCMAVMSLDGQLDLSGIEGRVELDLDGDGDLSDEDQGLEGVTIRLNRTADGEQLKATTTGGGGYYRFDDIPAGSYLVSVESLPEYQSTGDVDDTEQDSTLGTIAINLGVDQNARGLDFLEWKLPGEGAISGFVLEDPNGDGIGSDAVAGIENAEVFLKDLDTNLEAASSVYTGEDGAFSFTNLPEGDYRLIVSLNEVRDTASATFTEQGLKSVQRVEIKTVTVPQESPVQFLVSKLARISGKVVDDGNPATGLSNARIKLLHPDGSLVGFHGQNPVFTQGSGGYFFDVYAGEYVIEELDPPGYSSIDDSEGSFTDNRISVSVTSGKDSGDHVFTDTQKDYSISLHRLDESGVINLNEPSGSNPSSWPEIEPLMPVNEWAILDIQPSVTEGLVADGVTPLLIKFCSTDPISDSLNVRWIVEEVSGGTIGGGIFTHMQRRINGEWAPAAVGFNSAILTQVDPCEFVLIKALDPSSLVFEPGSKEIVLLFKLLTDNESPTLIDEKRIVIRRPPLLLRSRHSWSDAFIDLVSEHVPDDFLEVTKYDASADTLNHYFQRIRESWAVNRMDVVAHGISGLSLRRELEAGHFRESYDLYRGAIGRLIFVGTPHGGSRLVPFLREIETRLKLAGLSRSFPRILPASSSEAFSWNDFVDDPQKSGSLVPKYLDPGGRIYTKESVYDPNTSVIYLVTAIDGENAPAFKRVGLTESALRAVFRQGSDGLVGVISGTSSNDIYHLLGKINVDKIKEEDGLIAHGEPAELFATEESQTKSLKVAERINELFEKGTKTVPVFFVHENPSPLRMRRDIEDIKLAAQDVLLADIVDVGIFLNVGGTSEENSNSLPQMQAFEEGTRKFDLKFDPPEAYPVVGEVFWTAERYGPDGVTLEGVSVETAPGDPSSVTVSVDPLVTGDVVLFLSYETTDGALVFGEPQWITHQDPLLGEVDHLELLPDGYTFRIGESFQSELVTVYTDGTRLSRWLDPLAIVSVSSSDPEVLSVENFPEVEALSAGVATMTVNAFGLTAEAQITVESEPEALEYDSWKAGLFSASELNDPSVSGDAVDLDGDSLNLFLEFITGGDPRIPNPGYLPQVTEIIQGTDTASVISLRVSTQVAGEIITAQKSSDLSLWNEIVNVSDPAALNDASIVDYIEGDGYRELFLEIDSELPAFYRILIESEGL